MFVSPEILRLRVLLCFLSDDPKACTVTGISRTLGEQKYTITRILTALEKQGLIDKSDSRKPRLTDSGLQKAKLYEERINITLNHLIYEGLDAESAHHDALHWALYSTDKSMQAIRETEERYRVKYELKDKKQFSGTSFCKTIKDGIYMFPFVIYCEHIKNGSNISETNENFEHPCILKIESSSGTIQMHATNNTIKDIKYDDNGTFVRAEKNASIFSLPAASFNFMNIGKGVGQILHGSICLKIQYSSNTETTAIFTLMI